LVTAGFGSAQTKEQSPDNLIRFLTYQSDRPSNLIRDLGLFTCGSANALARENRAAAASLVRLGASAIPSLEGALDSIEQQGEHSEFSPGALWLLAAYAKIDGPAAYPRLRRMISEPRLDFLQPGLDNAVALSLDLTSYVSSSRQIPVGMMILCDGGSPRDFLDQFILAWEKNSRPSLEANLGPNARTALRSLLKGRNWAAMRADLWRGTPGGAVALGYRLDTADRLAKPRETLEEVGQGVTDAAPTTVNFEIDAFLKNSPGGDCGKSRIKFFRREGKASFTHEYVVDNADLGDLLRSIATCAAVPQ
jgi:hypothetical protein